jgi:hypothetical protein
MSVADHILHQELRIVRQRELIAKLESRGDCAAALCQARACSRTLSVISLPLHQG